LRSDFSCLRLEKNCQGSMILRTGVRFFLDSGWPIKALFIRFNNRFLFSIKPVVIPVEEESAESRNDKRTAGGAN
jgi:hypothetical protein